MAHANLREPTWRSSIPAWAKGPLRRVRESLLFRPMVTLGWRPARSIPVAPVYLRGDYGFEDEERIKAAVAIVHEYTHVSFEALATLWQQVRFVDKYRIPGALVECGVWRGGAVGLMALAHMSSAPPARHLHLFDSFQGLPEPRAEFDGAIGRRLAGESVNGVLQPIDQVAAPLADSEQLLSDRIRYPERLTHYHVGWFQDTLPRDKDSIGEIALLRIDGDWYESTKVCLEHLYSKVVSNGVVIIDDYGHFEGCRRAVDEFIASQPVPIMLHHIDYTARYWIKA